MEKIHKIVKNQIDANIKIEESKDRPIPIIEKVEKEVDKIVSKTRILEYIEKIYVLRDLKRYNNALRIKDESVAEHLSFVTLIVIELHNHYVFDLTKAMIMASTHDLSEIYVTDIPHVVKRDFPNIGKEIKIAEHIVFEAKFSPLIVAAFKEFELGKSAEAKIVQLADVLSCMQYGVAETKLGNTGYMQRVVDNSKIRMEEIFERLEEFRR